MKSQTQFTAALLVLGGLALAASWGGSVARSNAADASRIHTACSGMGQPSVVHPGRSDRAAPVDRENQDLLSIQSETHRKVKALTLQETGLPDGSARDALERQVQQAKLDGELRFLALLAEKARSRGDLAEAARADRVAETLRCPWRPGTGVAQPLPEKLLPGEGGSR
jgi:hypothetical protein